MVCRQADGLASNSVLGMRYDATELMAGLTDCCGRNDDGGFDSQRLKARRKLAASV